DCCYLVLSSDFFFFFQAEDGIRDKLVTGVQTCALPICRVRYSRNFRSCTQIMDGIGGSGSDMGADSHGWCIPNSKNRAFLSLNEIGRASCRERVWSLVGGAAGKENKGNRMCRYGGLMQI